MSIKTFCSCYVPLANVSNAPVLLDDHVLFNQMIRGTLGIKMREMAANAAAKAAGTPPAKGSPGGGKRKAGAQSIHTFLSQSFRQSCLPANTGRYPASEGAWRG